MDLDDEARERLRAIAIPEPARVASDPQVLSNDRRYDVAVTVICCEFRAEQVQGWIDGGAPFVAELAAITDRTLVDLPTGHWPQLTRPNDLARVILESL